MDNVKEKSAKSLVSKGLRNFQKIGIYLALIFILILFTILNQNFIRMINLLEVVSFVSVLAIIAIGQTFVIAGKGIDLSVGAVVALSGSVMAGLHFIHNINPIVAIFMGLAISTSIGFFHGFIIAKTGVPDIIVTLAGMETWRGIAWLLYGERMFTKFPRSMVFLGGEKIGPVPNTVIVLIVLLILSTFVLRKTRLGRYILAIGGNRKAAEFVGISYVRYKVFSYMISGFFCGLAALIYIGRVRGMDAGIGLHYPLNSIAAVVVGGSSLFGGVATILGTMVGALVVALIRNGLQLLGINFYWFLIILGFLIVIAVYISVRGKKKNGGL